MLSNIRGMIRMADLPLKVAKEDVAREQKTMDAYEASGPAFGDIIP